MCNNSTRCRTCLSNTLNLTPVAHKISFDNKGVNMTIKDLIKECASVEINFDDLRPQSICNLCVENARITYVFRKTCQASELFLSQQEEESSSTSIIPFSFGMDDPFSSEDEKPLSSVVISSNSNINIKRCLKSKQRTKADHAKRYMESVSRIRVKGFAKAVETNGVSNIDQEQKSCILDEELKTVSDVTISSNMRILMSSQEIDRFKSEDSREYICPICNRAFKSQKTFILHLKRHDEAKWKRKFADSFKIMSENSNRSSANLLLQMSCVDESNTNQLCPICNKSFSSIKYLQRHIRRHQASGRLSIRNFNKKLNHQLLMTEKISNTSKPVKRRRKNNGQQQQFDCNVCSSQFTKRALLKDHLKEVHNVNKVPSKCTYCDWTGNAADLAKHKEEHSEFKNFLCEYCEKKFFNKKSLQIHTLIHTGEKKHMCHYCGKSFAVKHNLKMHIRTHTGEKPYKCTMCEKTFAQKSEVTVHMITHSEERNYVCSVCGVTCRRKGALRDHLRSHLPVEEWDKCNVCGKAFRTKEQLKDHMHQHTGERNHVCSICGKDYGRRRNLRTHIKMIHTAPGTVNPHLCMVCGKSFTQKHVLSAHMKTHEK